MSATASTTLNNVDLAAVGALVEAIREQPDAAATTWAAEVRWNGGFKSEARSREFAPVASDEPRALGARTRRRTRSSSSSARSATASPSVTPPMPPSPASPSATCASNWRATSTSTPSSASATGTPGSTTSASRCTSTPTRPGRAGGAARQGRRVLTGRPHARPGDPADRRARLTWIRAGRQAAHWPSASVSMNGQVWRCPTRPSGSSRPTGRPSKLLFEKACWTNVIVLAVISP